MTTVRFDVQPDAVYKGGDTWAVLPGEEPEPFVAPLCIRHGTMVDLPYLEDVWTKAAVKDRGGPQGERWVRVDNGRLLLALNEWHDMRHDRIKATLARSGILVGHRHDAPEVVWAFLVFEVEPTEGTASDVTMTLHWAWTRPELRGRGYAQALLAKARALAGIAVNVRTRCSHMTPAGEALIAKVNP